jgi:hypothetical protein
MAELSQAYGYGDSDSFAPQNDYYEDSRSDLRDSRDSRDARGGSRGGNDKQEMQRENVPHVSNNSQQLVQPPPMAPEFTPQTQRRQVAINPSYSFGDRMTMKRGEVIKLAMFSLVIVMAIALDRIGTHYLTKYLSDNIFTDFQEFMLRLSYPVVIFIILWIVKSL